MISNETLPCKLLVSKRFGVNMNGRREKGGGEKRNGRGEGEIDRRSAMPLSSPALQREGGGRLTSLQRGPRVSLTRIGYPCQFRVVSWPAPPMNSWMLSSGELFFLLLLFVFCFCVFLFCFLFLFFSCCIFMHGRFILCSFSCSSSL